MCDSVQCQSWWRVDSNENHVLDNGYATNGRLWYENQHRIRALFVAAVSLLNRLRPTTIDNINLPKLVLDGWSPSRDMYTCSEQVEFLNGQLAPYVT